MEDLLLSPRVLRLLDTFAIRPPHALLLVGANNSGKFTIASRLIENILGIKDGIEKYAYYKHVTPSGETKLSIGIDEIKAIKYFLQLKTVGQQEIKRAVLVEDSHLMTRESQNALLKTLEEPPADTILILTANTTEGLLPTIMSRVSLISLEIPSLPKTVAYLEQKGYTPEVIKSAYYRSGGATGAIINILQNKNSGNDEATELAKSILSSPLYDRLLKVDKLAKDKILTVQTLKVMSELCRLKLRSTVSSPKDRELWKTRLAAIIETEINMKWNVNTKLALTNLCLNL